MKQTIDSYRSGITPPWCSVIAPSGPVLETHRYYIFDMPQFSDIVASHGDKVKISLLFCASDLTAYYYEDWDEWIREYFTFSVGLKNMYDELDRFYLNVGVFSDAACKGFEEYVSEEPGYYSYNDYVGYFKDLNWSLIEYEKVIPEPFVNLNSWRVQLILEQDLYGFSESNSVMWFNHLCIHHNDVLIWQKNFGSVPEVDPPPVENGSSVIRANKSPWTRWNRAAPICPGGVFNG